MQKLSVIVPVYNEAPHLEEVMRFLFSSVCPVERQWILINDCSTDESRRILETLQPEFSFELVQFAENRGKGAAIREGIRRATGDLIMIQDADFEYDPRDVPQLLAPLLSNEADVVFGARFTRSGGQVPRTYHYFVNRLLTTLSNLLSGMYVSDMETCYKIFRADLLRAMNLTSNRFGIEVELTAYVAKTSARVFERPIHYYPRTFLQGKKINWRDGFAALVHLVRFNLFRDLSAAFTSLPPAYRPGVPRRPFVPPV